MNQITLVIYLISQLSISADLKTKISSCVFYGAKKETSENLMRKFIKCKSEVIK